MVMSDRVHTIGAIMLVASLFIEFRIIRYSLFFFVQYLAVESTIEYHVNTALYPTRLSLIYHIIYTLILGYTATFYHLIDYISVFIFLCIIHLLLWVLILKNLELPKIKINQLYLISNPNNNNNNNNNINLFRRDQSKQNNNIFANLLYGPTMNQNNFNQFNSNANRNRNRNNINNNNRNRNIRQRIAGETITITDNINSDNVENDISFYFDILSVPNNIVHRLMGYSSFLQLYFELIQCKVLYFDHFRQNKKLHKRHGINNNNNNKKNRFSYNLNESMFLDDDTNIYDGSYGSGSENKSDNDNGGDSDNSNEIKIDSKQLSQFINDYMKNHRKYDQLNKRHFSEMAINFFGLMLIPFLYFHIFLLFNSQHSLSVCLRFFFCS